MTLAALTVFAITGSMGYAKSYMLNEHLHSSWLNKELCDELNKTNVQVNSNTATIDAMSQDLLKTVKASKKIEEIKNRQQEEIAERAKGDLANSNAIKAETKAREAKDAAHEETMKELGAGVLSNAKAIDKETAEREAEIERLDEEKASKKFVDSGLNAAREALKAEKAARKEADAKLNRELVVTHDKLNDKIADETKERALQDAALAGRINEEAVTRAEADKAHEAEIAEVKNRQQEEIAERVKGDLANSNAIKAETKVREAKDTELAGKIAEERKDRQDADTELNDGIKANKELIKKEVKNREAAVKTVKEMADNAQKSADKANAAIENKETGLAAAHTKAEAARVEADKANAAVAEETTARKEADRIHDAAIESNRSAISHLDKKVNKGTAMLVAMSNVDFQDVNAGEVAVGAGVGHYVGDQAVAVGVAYGVNDDFKVHAKFSGVAGDPHYNAIGGGLTYKFRTR